MGEKYLSYAALKWVVSLHNIAHYWIWKFD